MEYTEELKKEADSVVEKYSGELYQELVLIKQVTATTLLATHCAIQDRQSVLDLAKVAIQTCMDEQDEFWQNEIKSLNQQIEYLKSKL